MTAPITVALLGGGTVGSQVARLILEQSDDLAARIGAPLELVGVAVRDSPPPRDVTRPIRLTATFLRSHKGWGPPLSEAE